MSAPPTTDKPKPNLNVLAPQQRRVYKMVYLESRSDADVAAALGVKIRSVYAMCSTVRRLLKLPGLKRPTAQSREQMADMLSLSPETGEDLVVSSNLATHNDGSYSFTVSTVDGEHSWRHTIKTEEL